MFKVSFFKGMLFIVLSVFCVSSHAAQTSVELRVLSDRTESHLKEIFGQFEKKTGVKILASFMDAGLVDRMESRPTEADIVITKDADLLELAKKKNLLQSFSSSAILSDVPEDFRDKDRKYIVDAYRARVILYSKDRVKVSSLSSYGDLASQKWKGKLCIRSGFHDYNIALFGQFMASYGKEESQNIMKGLHANLAREPKGNDREQAKGIFEGKCDVALLNTYYYPIMLANTEQKSWAEATKVFFPEQDKSGTFIMRSGAALTTSKKNVKIATELLEFLVSQTGQEIMANTTFQYPVNKSVHIHEALRSLGAEQGTVKDGKFKVNFIPLSEVAKYRDTVVKNLNDINFDKIP